MKVEITQNESVLFTFVEIHCKNITDEEKKLRQYIERYQSSITAKADDETVSVPVNDILYIESVDKRTFIYTKENVLSSDKRLYELEEILDKSDFFRCSKSVIVNINKINKLKPEITRNILATLSNGEVIVVSRRYAANLRSLLGIGG